MPPSQQDQLSALSNFLQAQRSAILAAWRNAADNDPTQTTVHVLTRDQFEDHIPQVLDAFQRKLCTRPGDAADLEADANTRAEEVKHGLHRWQEGYRLLELVHEWGHLQLCLFQAIESYAATHPEFERETLVAANHQMITLVNEAISESAAQYERMQKAEAAGRLGDLEVTLANLNAIERRRTALIHEAVHDINGNVFGVAMAAKFLGESDVTDGDRAELARLLEHGVHSVAAMLNDLKELARLEAGREIREIREFDAVQLVAEMGNADRPLADASGLYLKFVGPNALSVDGDAVKVRRLLHNLLLNALKYTRQGGVTLSVGAEANKWWCRVEDTGPGIQAGPGAPLVIGLKEATESARESDPMVAAPPDRATGTPRAPAAKGPAMLSAHQQPGEGVGLSIVKRLCELLDGSLEMTSTPGRGTTFRVVLPRRY